MLRLEVTLAALSSAPPRELDFAHAAHAQVAALFDVLGIPLSERLGPDGRFRCFVLTDAEVAARLTRRAP